jgi:hypothetical protein
MKYLTLRLLVVTLFVVGAGAVSAQTFTDERARQVLSIAGISVNHPAPRTSLEGIRTATLNAIVALNRDSGAGIVITGGTESTGGHKSGTYSHENGYKVDLSLNPTLTNYIEKNFRKVDPVGGYPAYKCPAGNLYVKEGNHWDVTVY